MLSIRLVMAPYKDETDIKFCYADMCGSVDAVHVCGASSLHLSLPRFNHSYFPPHFQPHVQSATSFYVCPRDRSRQIPDLGTIQLDLEPLS